MIDQALAAPVECAAAPRHVSYPAREASRATGSQLHFSAPVRASKARTIPFGAAAREPSDTEEPTTASPLTIAGGEVMEYSLL